MQQGFKEVTFTMTNLMTKQTPQLWPPYKLDEQLAEEFADFFEDKIAKIRQALSDKPKYKTTKDTIPRFTNFALMTESQVLKAINSLKSK